MIGSSLLADLRCHPRVEGQALPSDDARLRLLAGAPELTAFPGRNYSGGIAILDWDHRLPSRAVVLRVLACYTPTALAELHAEYDEHLAHIRGQDRFPEFDVPDYSELEADEAYEFEVDLEGAIQSSRLVTAARREVEERAGREALEAVRRSKEFAIVKRMFPRRPATLGVAEAVQWSAPCESKHPKWTIDVWYLVALEGVQGRGKSFLVDPDTSAIVATRDFTVRLS